jgi:hypothetical protein
MGATGAAFRAAALLAAGAFALHQLRYLVGYGDGAGHALATQGHGYLQLVEPILALALAGAAGQLVAAVARRSGVASGRSARWGLCRLWLVATAALAATYVCQELVEGALSAGHPSGIAAVLAAGGWWALPLAVGLGLVIALAVRGADAVVAAAPGHRGGRVTGSPSEALAVTAHVDLPRLALLGTNLAGRAPPDVLRLT